MIRRVCLFLLVSVQVFAQDLNPWTERPVGILPKFEYVFQTWEKGPDHLFNLSSTVAAFDYAGEIEAFFSNTKKHSIYFDGVQLTGRKEIWQDTVGDPFQLTVGGSLAFATNCAVLDPGVFFPGNAMFSLHASLGKEFGGVGDWVYRTYGTLLAAIANRGSPWFRADWHIERQFLDGSSLGFGLLGWVGLGKHKVSYHPFRGYSSVKFRALDLKVSYRFNFLELAYSVRLASSNFQSHLQTLSLQFIDFWF